MSAHSPKPWTVQENEAVLHLGSRLVIKDAMNYGVAVPFNAGQFGEANARLMAAAPEMLEALKALKHSITFAPEPQGQYLREMIDAAIAKAEGRV
jgi:hypothetical protein